MLNKDANCLTNILEAIVKIENYIVSINHSDELNNDSKTFDAVLMNFIVIGEMAGKLSEDFKNNHIEIEWWKIKGLRNIVAHNYFGVDTEEIWQIIHHKIPPLKLFIEKITK